MRNLSYDDYLKIKKLLEEICFLSHKHEVQYWLDAPGSDEEKLRKVSTMAREALALVRNEPS